MTTKHESKRDEIAAYLLGALDPEEAASLERHLATGCVECRAELRWLEPAVQLLPESVEQLRPPRSLRKRILAEARQEAGPAAAHRRARMRFGGGRGFSGRSLAAAAALALVLAAVAGYAIGGGGDQPATTTVAAGSAPGVTAKVISEGSSGTLQLANVHQLPRDRVLEAWVRRDGEVVPVHGVFLPDRGGNATAMIPDIRGVDAVMVTAEPRGGSPAPTSAPMVTLEMPG